MDSLKDALMEALGERKLKGGLDIQISVQPKEEGLQDAPMVEHEDAEQDEALMGQKPSEEMGEKDVLQAMMGAGADVESVERDMDGRKPKTLGERAKLEGAKKLKQYKE